VRNDDANRYRPIDCAFHEELVALATFGRVIEVSYCDERGAERVVRDRIADVLARAGVEYIRTASGLEIRLDRLKTVDGRAVPTRSMTAHGRQREARARDGS